MTSHGLLRDASHLLAGGVLLCAFLLLLPRRSQRAIGTLAIQGLLLGALAALQGWARGEAGLFGAAVLVLAGSGVGLPAALRRIGEPPRPDATLGSAASLAAGMGLAITTVLLILPLLPADDGNPGLAAAGQSMGAAACTLLLGLLLSALRRDVPGQLLGLCCAGNGALLAVVIVPGLPLPILPAIGIACLGGVAGGLLLARRMLDGFGRPGLATGRIPGSTRLGPVAPNPAAAQLRPRFQGLARLWKRPS